ncbi:cytochrome c biogenesis protein CcdA [Limibaculum sp. M0105]|uniref:Cytochrome c biogenesis protein CcdA n=1 Tax=Thermohalobaculum xanthum TaxID=2753746 RepID=A0A8J7SJ02_9RHOB|nr:cytochrome c biogenesis protein CcdA [Thermohalobaculum xanthum]MBK0400655.1 cytochrome c biogenesis protein CcdA [Thermohalobaculum xanthum]
MEIGLFTAFIGGLISFLSPCVLPLAPPYLAYLGGTTLDQISGESGETDAALRRRVFLAALCFVLGLGTVFVLLGMGASAVGQALLSYKTELARVSGALIIVLGAHFLGLIRIPFLNREARFGGPAEAGSLGASYLIGIAFAFGWTPCIGPILAAILTLAAQQDTLGAGTALLAVYAAGLGVPFLVAALFVGPFLRWAKGVRRHMGLIEKAMGALLVVVGLMIMTGEFERIAYWLLETFPILATFG